MRFFHGVSSVSGGAYGNKGLRVSFITFAVLFLLYELEGEQNGSAEVRFCSSSGQL